MRLIGLILLVLCYSLTPAWGAKRTLSDQRQDNTLTFGVYAHVRSTELLKKFAPIIQYLEASTATQGVARRIVMRIFPTYAEAINALADGHVDFARYGPVSYVWAKKKNPAVRLLAMENNHGKKRFNGVIFVPQTSEIQRITQLRNTHVAFGSRMSTTSRYLSQAQLVEAGIMGSDLSGFSYLGRHDKVAFAVAAGQYDAGAMNGNTFTKYAQSKGLRKISEFPCATKPWVAREGLPSDVFFALQNALMKLDDPAILKAINRTGFLPAADSDYDLIRKSMELAREFELLALRFGTYASETPTWTYGSTRPILKKLEGMLDEKGSPTKLETEIFPTNAQATDALIKGIVDLARLGPASYLLAKKKNAGVRGLVAEDKGDLSSEMVIVVRNDSKIRTLSDLAGHSLAFGDPDSTEGRYFAQAELVQAGIHASDLNHFDYLGRHDRVAAAVGHGKFDAGAIRDTTFDQYKINKGLRAIHRVIVPDKIWAVREGVDPELSESLRSGLLSMRDPSALMGIQRSGFKPMDEAMLESVHRAMERAGRFEIRP